MPPEPPQPPSFLLGRWIPDAAVGGTAPFVELEFRQDGKLRYSVKGEGIDQAVILDYRTEGHILVTRQPGSTADSRAHFERGHDGSLILELAGKRGRYVRAN